MGIEDLAVIEIFRGVLSLIFIIVSLFIGIKLMLKYFEHKKETFITIGLTWIFLTTAWWHSTINIMTIILTGEPANLFLGLILMNFFVGPALLCWIYTVTTLLYERNRTKIMMLSSVVIISYEILLIALLFINPNLIGEMVSDIIIRRAPLTLWVAIISIIISVITGFLLSIETLKSSDKKVRWKGRFLMIAFTLFLLGAILDSVSWSEIYIVVIIRIMLISSAICYYLGFFLPDRVAKFLIKEE